MNQDEEYKKDQAAAQETEAQEPAAEQEPVDTALTQAPAEATPEEQAAPAEDKVFGMPRRIFQGTALGIACGFILQGVLGANGIKVDGLTMAVVCGGIGWFIAKKILAKQQAAQSGDVTQTDETEEKK